ncbi:AfsR/SARP family transcriptional regulator [Planobispora longispora]|uniref:SARP family transcriptional regulator n=1 Tax=Planobispora longispora TaxID=28887 RepID=A0A8J3RM62_9ACTN|nr:BTAD domain-containing putative transcriptional regulator [Planobispora longispora]BFE88019.1 hypothetical protein GCM10020093_106200 [Planobispora longispora]GIH77528.1 hypothetical protein Plo01_39570 [Planobispora longispora]
MRSWQRVLSQLPGRTTDPRGRLAEIRRRQQVHRTALAELDRLERESLARLGDPEPGAGPGRAAGLIGARPDLVLAVHLLGPLTVTVADRPVESWPNGRCRSLLAYLLTHRRPWPQREKLMEVFWPGSPPEAARNSLQVAVHNLRRALRSVSETPLIVLAGGSYRLRDDVSIWLDTEELIRLVSQARQLETRGEPYAATVLYEDVAALYRGDFLADFPYDDWPALAREHLRLAYLDALDRLSALYFASARYAACVAVCQQIIELDPCREDAHRRLMRCHCRQGRPHLALLQFRVCARLLETEFDIAPSRVTVELRDRIHRREPV